MADSDLLHIESRFRLTGEVAGRQRTFLLVMGENRIGSLPSNDIVLKEPGVSRQHALLEVGESEIVLTDLGSKNGTFVLGDRIREERLIAGAEIGVGSVTLLLTEIDDDEAAMAFVVPSRPPGTADPPPEAETEVKGLSGGHQGVWLELLDRYLSVLCQGGRPALSGALGQVVYGLGAKGAVVCEWRPPGQPMFHAVWGHEDENDHRSLLERLDTNLGSRSYRAGYHREPAPFAYCLYEDTENDTLWVLLLLGCFELMGSAEPLLRSVLSGAYLAQTRNESVPHRPRSVQGSSLVFPDGHVVGASAEINVMYRELETACRAAFPVLVLGETGVGKEHVAKILHLSSPRGPGPFMAINCAAIPAELLEAELFGIRGGVATGVSQRQGRFQMAQGGTIFLDEVGDMPLPLQAKLLRVLEEGEVTPVGGKPVAVDVRIVAATNADLLEHVEHEQFRRDLYYRLAGYVLRVPPLRERRDDIPILVEHFLLGIAAESGRHVRGITLRAMRALASHEWPGNIRELVHEVRRLVYVCHDGEAVDYPLLSKSILSSTDKEPENESLDLAEQTAALERRLIRNSLGRTGGNRSQAAKLLGISRQGLAMKMDRLGLEMDDL